jgi:hypothetical protein
MSSDLLFPAAEPHADQVVDSAAVLSALRSMTISAEPGVVFTSLTEVCVPVLCDGCRVRLKEDGGQTYSISYPCPELAVVGENELEDSAITGGSLVQRAGEQWVSTPVLVDAVAEIPGYRGMVVHFWRKGYRPGAVEAALAQSAVDHAIALISHQRLTDQVQALQRKTTNLRVALSSNREIGTALGILMTAHRISLPEAFELLRTVSQHSHRKLNDLAAEVVYTGALDQQLTARSGGQSPVSVAAPQRASTSLG